MKKALIIGGSGGLSSVVAKTLLLRDYKVWAVTRGKRELPAGVIPIKADGACFPWICLIKKRGLQNDLRYYTAFI